jgi:hypothetical protein
MAALRLVGLLVALMGLFGSVLPASAVAVQPPRAVAAVATTVVNYGYDHATQHVTADVFVPPRAEAPARSPCQVKPSSTRVERAGSRLPVLAAETATAAEGSAVLKGPIADEVAANLPEQMTLDSARTGNGEVIIRNLGDEPRLAANYGPGEWVKMENVARGTDGNVTVHWFRNLTTGQNVEFKFTSRHGG